MCSPDVCPHSETVAERRTEKHLEADEIARVMGKGGRKGKQPAAAADDDALLDAAIAQASAEREKAEADKAAAAKAVPVAPPGKTLTMAETLAKLDTVMAFTISRLLSDGSKDTCPSPSGAVTFYTEAADAKADLEELKAADPAAQVALDFTPLGRAFALTQGLMGLKTPGPTKLQFSRANVSRHGQSGLPEELRERMSNAGPFPLFYSDKLGSEQFTPVFFDVADMHEMWVTCGGDRAKLPEPTVTDLRIVVARTMQEPGQWEPLHFIPPKTSEALTTQLGAKAQREEVLKTGFTRGAQMLKEVSHAAAVEDGSEPPPLAVS